MSYAISSTKFSLKKFRQKQNLSSQISLTYAVILFATIFLVNIGTTAGVYYLFHHQAERALDISISRVSEKIQSVESLDKNFLYSGAVMSSVILRVTDDKEKIFLDNSPSFPALEKILQFKKNNSPFWASEKYQLIETPNSFFYYKNLPLEVGGKIFNFHFLKTITFEKNFIRNMLWIILLIDLVGLTFAIMIGNKFSKKILNPLKNFTEIAKKISAGNLGKRIEVENSAEEITKLAESFNKMLDRLEESFRQQQRFIADASHEFRTPVTVIRGYADMLKIYGANDSEFFAEATDSIQNSSKNLQNLIERLLFLARADQNNLPTKKIPLNVNQLLIDVAESFKNPRIKFIGNENFEIIGDENFLKKMFSEIVENALNFSRDDVFIEIQNSPEAVKIIDKGIGIAEEDIEKIFDRFYRADKSRTKIDDNKISAGLGLSIAKWIADNHKIKFEISSNLDEGTSFSCIF